jgi:uncharacterized protein YbjT (DUF2867 family)
MLMENNRIVVCGATGNQGGAVAGALLNSGRWAVTALTRDPDSGPARALAAQGAELVKADLLDMASLRSAFVGAYGVFGLTQPWSPETGKFDTAAEIRQGKNIIWACRETGVSLPVLSTIINLDNRRAGIPYIDSKLLIEELFRSMLSGGVIVRPSLYSENIGTDMLKFSGTKISGRFGAGFKIPYLALDDLGKFVAQIFESPQQVSRAILNLASHLISGEELASLLGSVGGGRRFAYAPVSAFCLRLFRPQFYRMRKFFEQQAGLIRAEGKDCQKLFFLPAEPISKSAFLQHNVNSLFIH